MAVNIYCKFSGIAFRLPFDCPEVRVVQVHPVLNLELDQLSKLGMPKRNQDCELLFTAWLYQLYKRTDLIYWESPPALRLSKTFIDLHIQKVASLVLYLTMNNSLKHTKHFPKLRIDSETINENLVSWLDKCNSIRALQADRIKDETTKKLIAANSISDHDLDLPVTFTKSVRKARTRKDYIESSLAGKPAEYIRRIVHAIFRAKEKELPELKFVKSVCLDLLDESNETNFTIKENIIRELNTVIFSKSSMLQLLSTTYDNDLQEDIEGIHAEYTVKSGGQSFTQSGFELPSIKHNYKEPTVPDAEPRVEDFKSYSVWKLKHDYWRSKQS